MKKKYVILITLVLIVLTGINVWILVQRECKCDKGHPKCQNANCYISKTISLNDKQKKQYNQIKGRFQQKAILIADSLHISQENLMQELMKEKSDSVKVRQLETKVTACQSELLHLSVEQYFEIRDILEAHQVPALNELFTQIFVCRPTCNHRDDDGGTIPHLE